VPTAASGVRRATRFAGGDMARLVLFDLGTGAPARLAWHATLRAGATAWYDAVVDATTGKVLYRANLTRFDANALIYENYPGAPNGGTATSVDLEAEGYLAPAAPTLSGPNAHAYSDVDGEDDADASEEVQRSAPDGFVYPMNEITSLPEFAGGSRCETFAICGWDSSDPTSWTANREQTTVQEFWFNNNYHDHLLAAPIGFDRSSGNFEDEDPVLSETDDGAATDVAGTGPTGPYLNNANMGTPPDGQSPRMQMYLDAYDTQPYEQPDDQYDGLFRDNNNSDDAATVYHEYTHGLSSRLVTNADGSQALDAAQSGAMGEAWSDWYALDYLVREGLFTDDDVTAGQVDLGEYSDAVPNVVRYQPIDCPLGSGAPACPGSTGAGAGGFTYGDFGKIYSGGAEVHADGEIWGETLWDLREAFVADTHSQAAGSALAEALVTTALRLSPPQPTMLDERNAIIQADTALYGGSHSERIWDIFAARGMGYFASVAGGTDVNPVEDFSTPPGPATPTGSLQGHVTDADTGLGIDGAHVGIGGLSTPGFDGALADDTAADGAYAIAGIPVHTYPKVSVGAGPGYFDQTLTNVNVAAGLSTTADAIAQRTWAFGGDVDETLPFGADYGCGAGKLNDASQGTVWEVEPPDPAGPYPTATIELTQPIDVSSYGLDPGEGCGSSGDAALKDYVLESSTNGTDWTTVSTGSFAPADAHQLNPIAPAGDGKGVRFVRLTAKSAQDNAYGYLDVAELAVFGGPPNVLPAGTLSATPGTVVAGGNVSLSAASFTDPDSAISGYAWDFDGNGSTDATTSTPTTNHVYPTAGSFTAKVSVGDYRGGAGTATAPVNVKPVDDGGGGGGGGGTTTTTPTTTTPTTTTPPPPPDSGVKAPTSKALLRIRRGEARLQVACPTATPCRVRARLLLSAADARRLHFGARTRATRVLTGVTKPRTLAIGVTPAVLRRARLRHLRALTVKVNLLLTPKNGRPVSKVYLVRLTT
jgi:extracellular elastinolytic metalloproteinase